MKQQKRIVVVCVIVLCASLSACRTSDNFAFPKQQLSSSPSPVLIWEPEYYTYKNGKYQFTQGYYRPVINRKQHYKRSMKGYMTKKE